MTVPYTARVIVSSSAVIICGLLNFILTLLRKAFGVIDTVSDIAQSNLDYSQVGTWKKLLSAAGSIKAIFTLSVNALTILQIISGIIGIALAILVNSKKSKVSSKFVKFKIIPFICGIIISVLGAVSYLALLLSKSSPIFLSIIMFLTVLFVPIIFTVFSKGFWRGDKN